MAFSKGEMILKPTITVLMPVYNVEKYIRFAIDSILSQTYEDFSFLIIDDASTDHTVDIICEYQDKRIKLIRNSRNLGVANSLNKGLAIIDSPYIARMDGDDISNPTRFEKQLAYMKFYPKLSIVGSHMELIDDRGTIIKKQNKQVENENIKVGLFLGHTSLAHPSIIIKRSALNKFRLQYDSAYQYAEDYELYCKASQYIEFDNYPEALVQYRIHPESVSQKHRKQQIMDAKTALYLHLRRLQLPFNLENFNLHTLLAFPPKICDEQTKADLIQWVYFLECWNKKSNLFPANILAKHCEQYIDQIQYKEH